MKIIGKAQGNERIVICTAGEINDLQWMEGKSYNDRKSEVGISINLDVTKEAIESVQEMRKFKKEIKSMLMKFKKLAELLDDREDMDKK